MICSGVLRWFVGFHFFQHVCLFSDCDCEPIRMLGFIFQPCLLVHNHRLWTHQNSVFLCKLLLDLTNQKPALLLFVCISISRWILHQSNCCIVQKFKFRPIRRLPAISFAVNFLQKVFLLSKMDIFANKLQS